MEDLPAELTIDILSRLPVKTVIHCKLVCRKWRYLVLDSVFVNLHLSRSPTGLIIHHHPNSWILSPCPGAGILMWVEIHDKVDHHRLHHDPLMSFDLNQGTFLQNTRTRCTGSVNGLICLWEYYPILDNIYICNPITREYMILPRKHYYTTAVLVCGFGVSLVTGEYKVVRIFKPDSYTLSGQSELEADVYTLGTCQWRRVKGIPYLVNGFNALYGPYLNCSYLNGHCHWIVCDQDAPEKLCSFDLDKETFQLFPSPPREAIQGDRYCDQSLGVLKGSLCQLDVYSLQFTIWVMKEYGIKKSWHKEAVIKQGFSFDVQMLMWQPMWQPKYLIAGLKDGSILAGCHHNKLWAFNPKGKRIEATQLCDLDASGLAYRPSFLKLRNFKSERVHNFVYSKGQEIFYHQSVHYSF